MASRTRSRSNRKSNTGLSLIELMVSILMGIFLSAGIVAVYLESKRNYAAEEEIARIQENGRFAIDLLKRELSLAGFYGGYLTVDQITVPTSGDEDVSSDCTTAGWALDADDPVEMIDDFNNSWVTTSGTTFSTCIPASNSTVQLGSDIFTVKRTAGEPTMYQSAYVGADAGKTGQMYLKIEDWGDAKEWVYSDSTSLPADPNTTEYWEAYAKLFYIRTYSATVGDNIPTLCAIELVGNGMSERCLVEGVENMQIEFGIDTDGDDVPNRYSADPNDISAGVTARVYLQLRSIEELYSSENANNKSYRLGLDSNTATAYTDGYLRRIFSTTVQMRNAILPAR